jgi:DNA-binding transcriptional MocR family regulator
MINKRREHFINKITPILPEELEMISPDGGFFLSFRLRNEILERFPDFAKRLSESFISSSVYIPVLCEQFIRVPICGLREELLDLVADKITEHSAKIFGKVH